MSGGGFIQGASHAIECVPAVWRKRRVHSRCVVCCDYPSASAHLFRQGELLSPCAQAKRHTVCLTRCVPGPNPGGFFPFGVRASACKLSLHKNFGFYANPWTLFPKDKSGRAVLC